MSPDKRSSSGKPDTPYLEWAAAIVSTILVLAMVAYMMYEGITGDGKPPLATVQADTVIEADGGYLVMFTVSNSGGETAAALRVSGALLRDTATIEQSDASIDYLPPRATRSGGMFFSRDPRLYRLELRPVGFSLP